MAGSEHPARQIRRCVGLEPANIVDQMPTLLLQSETAGVDRMIRPGDPHRTAWFQNSTAGFDPIIMKLEMIKNLIEPIRSISVDIYTLSRMFTQTDSEEIIAFMGSTHIDRYAVFFNKYLDSDGIFVHYPEEDNRCVVVDGLGDYLDLEGFRDTVRN